jgi:hypothetical protein
MPPRGPVKIQRAADELADAADGDYLSQLCPIRAQIS